LDERGDADKSREKKEEEWADRDHQKSSKKKMECWKGSQRDENRQEKKTGDTRKRLKKGEPRMDITWDITAQWEPEDNSEKRKGEELYNVISTIWEETGRREPASRGTRGRAEEI